MTPFDEERIRALAEVAATEEVKKLPQWQAQWAREAAEAVPYLLNEIDRLRALQVKK